MNKYDLSFYHITSPQNRLNIEQSTVDREWMDQTYRGYAYRCLPMTYANRHGWCVRLTEDVQVLWDGSSHANGTNILTGREQNGARVADNGTGNGIVTFHLNAIPRTSPDFNLWIMGAPNLVIPGASPLSGVIESDWSPTSPTSNWKITEINKLVTFKKGDPVIFFIPIHKTELELFSITHRDISENEEMLKHFRDFLLWRAKLDEEGAEVFGKKYLKGQRTDGSVPTEEHMHKTRLHLNS